MAAEIYDQCYVFLDGILLGEATTIETTLEGDDQDAITLVNGWSGQTPSPKKRVTKVENMVLTTGMEYPFEEKSLDSVQVQCALQLGGSGKKCMNKGFLRGVSLAGGVGQPLKVTFEHHGEPAIFR